MEQNKSVFGRNPCPHCSVTVFLQSSLKGIDQRRGRELARLLLNLPKLSALGHRIAYGSARATR